MNRYIDADELIETIDCSADIGGALGKVVECVKLYAKHMIASAPTVNAWIPCDEQLPEAPTFCLVTTDGSYNDVIDIAMYMSDGWHKASKVLAWIPLPEPWKGERNGQI